LLLLFFCEKVPQLLLMLKNFLIHPFFSDKILIDISHFHAV